MAYLLGFGFSESNTSWRIRNAFKPSKGSVRGDGDLGQADARRSFNSKLARNSPSVNQRQGNRLGSHKVFGDMEVISTTSGGNQVTLIKHRDHIFLNGREIRLSRGGRVKLADKSPAPDFLQSFYEAAEECREQVLPERVTLSHSGRRMKSSAMGLKQAVGDVIDKIADLFIGSKEPSKKKRRRERKKDRACLAEKREELVRSLYALNEGSIHAANDVAETAKMVAARDENTKVLTAAVKQLCDESIEASMRDKMAAMDARATKGKIRSLQQENEEFRLKLRQRDSALGKFERDLGRNRHELFLSDREITNQNRKMEELLKQLEHSEEEVRREKDEKVKLSGEVLSLERRGSDMMERFYNLEKERENQARNLLEMKEELFSIKEALKRHPRSTGDSDRNTTTCRSIGVASADRDTVRTVQSSGTSGEDSGVRQLNDGDEDSLTGNPGAKEKLKVVNKWRDKFKILAGKTRKYREELDRVSAERDQLKRHKKRLAELARGAISDKEATTSRQIAMETNSRGAPIGVSRQEEQIRHLVKANQELERRIAVKQNNEGK